MWGMCICLTTSVKKSTFQLIVFCILVMSKGSAYLPALLQNNNDACVKNFKLLIFYLSCLVAALVLGLNGQPVLAEDVSIELSSENDIGGANTTGLRRIEDGSVISNMHTSKWRIFTDQGRELFLQA